MKKILFLFLIVFVFSSFPTQGVFADVLGQNVIFNIDSTYEYLSRSQIPATLRKVSPNAYWYVSDDYWAGLSSPEQSLFLSKLDELSQEFDSRIYITETQFWGSEPNPGIDSDPRITIFISRLVDQAGGYFDTIHGFEKSRVSNSNEREMVFINASSLTRGRGEIFLAHEFQHLIGFYQKDILRKASEDVWLNEARSEYSVRLLGYEDDFQNSNLRRRLLAFQQSPSDPLGEWKNLPSDYGMATLFTHYLADQYGDRILVDSLRSDRIGIPSVDSALTQNGFSETFSDVFANWTIANILNDSSLGPRFAYKFSGLRDFKIFPTQSFSLSGFENVISISNSVKDWQPVYYEFNTPIGDSRNLKIEFSAPSGSRFIIPYIAFNINGKKEISFVPLNGNSGALFIKNFGSEIYKVVLIPANHFKTSKFSANDPATTFELRTSVVSEVPEILPSVTPSPLSTTNSQQLIQTLLDQIAALQRQINQLSQKAPAQQPTKFLLNRDLFVGSRGEDVKALQDFLLKENVYPEGLVTGYFGQLTKNAVIRFQKKYEIFPQIGYIGVKTRAKIQELVF